MTKTMTKIWQRQRQRHRQSTWKTQHMLYFWNPDDLLIPNMMIDTSPWSSCSRRSVPVIESVLRGRVNHRFGISYMRAEHIDSYFCHLSSNLIWGWIKFRVSTSCGDIWESKRGKVSKGPLISFSSIFFSLISFSSIFFSSIFFCPYPHFHPK